MFTDKLLASAQSRFPARTPVEAFDPELETWQQLFDRRYPHHSELLDVLGKVESANEPVYVKVAEPDSGDNLMLGLLPNFRCSF